MKKYQTTFDFDKHKENETIFLSLKDLTSWSTEISIANIFSENKDFGIILQTKVNPEKVLVDIDMTLNDNRLGELILLPGSYTCKVIKTVRNKDVIEQGKQSTIF